ncbi:hypothetical protein [Fibrisoma limi]|nr:hypothetical protein [Fibrisoma limi]
MQMIMHSPVSAVHVAAALTAMVSGTRVIFSTKGTRSHRLIGRIYVLSMIVLLLTAFQIYYLFGRFCIIHWGAVGSIVALLIGLVPMAFRSVLSTWLRWHYVGMGASVTGLYAAFVVESTYRFFPPEWFWYVTIGCANSVFVVGAVVLYRHWPFPPLARPRPTSARAFLANYRPQQLH